MTELSPQQRDALDAIARWYAGRDMFSAEPFRLFGPAGTGKTTLAREVPAALGLSWHGIQYGAYTGKAASVLRGKGCTPASTLHSLVYKPQANAETKRKLEDAKREWDELSRYPSSDQTPEERKRHAELEGEIEALEKEARTIGWVWNPDSPLADASLLILDEVSMVDAKLAADIERFDVPVLVLGDPEQLEPVGGEGYYTMAEPDYALSEIHRQALESPVLELATRIRTSTDRRLGLVPDELAPRRWEDAMAADQVLVWKNATRWNMINNMRKRLDRPDGQVVPGDRVMCLTNNKDLGVFNGQQFDVLEATPGPLGPDLLVRDDSGAERRILAFADGFQGVEQEKAAKARYDGGKGNRMLATFANAITVHKAQGSEWPSVYVVNEAQDLMETTAGRRGLTGGVTEARRWLYTAVSRASDTVTVTRPRSR
jgi:exodeoxyribonuclease-5